jgi:hypothetical protein
VVLRAAVGYTSVGIAIPPIRFGHIDRWTWEELSRLDA